MSIQLRAFLFILTSVLFITMLVLAVWGFVAQQIILGVCCIMIAAAFSIFVYKDIQFFFGSKNGTPPSH